MSPSLRLWRSATLGLVSCATVLASTSAQGQAALTLPDRYSGGADAAQAPAPIGTLSAYTASAARASTLNWPGKAVFDRTPVSNAQPTRYTPPPYLQPATSASQLARRPEPTSSPAPLVATQKPAAYPTAASSAYNALPGPPVAPWYVRFSGSASNVPAPAPPPAPIVANAGLRARADLPKSIYDPPQAQAASAANTPASTTSTGARLYSVHRDLGLTQDADPIAPQFFNQTSDQGEPAGPSPIYKSTTSTGTSTAAHALQPVDEGSTLGGN